MIKPEDFTKIKHDVNGNPRYVAHFLKFLTKEEWSRNIEISEMYTIARKRARKFGGKKYHNKSYGGGIVFCTYSLESEVCALINKELAS